MCQGFTGLVVKLVVNPVNTALCWGAQRFTRYGPTRGSTARRRIALHVDWSLAIGPQVNQLTPSSRLTPGFRVGERAVLQVCARRFRGDFLGRLARVSVAAVGVKLLTLHCPISVDPTRV